MAVKYSPTTGVLRGYGNADGYDNREEYLYIVSVIWTSADKVVLFGAHGEHGKKSVLEVFRELYAMGAKTVEIGRANGHKMPWGVLVRSDEFEDWYSVDLMEVLG
jgi:acetyl-CoA carboxylase carboxyltransferase component